MSLNVLHLTPDFNYGDGRSYYVYLLLKYLKSNNNVCLLTNSGNSITRAEDLGIKVIQKPGLSDKKSFLKSVKFLANAAVENKIDLIHSHHRYFELLSNSIRGRKKIRTVFTSLSLVDRRYFIEYKSDLIIAVSNSIKDMLIKKFGIDEKKIRLVPNFVDEAELSNIKNPGIEPAEIYSDNSEITLLSIGRFHPEKNFETLLKAVAQLKDYNIRVILIGEGSELFRYREIISKKKIKALFFPPTQNLNIFFDASDICVLPSLRDPFPGFMLQCGLFGKPFIGARTDGIAELIDDNVNGLLFEKKNDIELSEKIKLFIENKKLAKSCSQNLYTAVIQKYTNKTVIPEIEKLYQSLFH